MLTSAIDNINPEFILSMLPDTGSEWALTGDRLRDYSTLLANIFQFRWYYVISTTVQVSATVQVSTTLQAFTTSALDLPISTVKLTEVFLQRLGLDVGSGRSEGCMPASHLTAISKVLITFGLNTMAPYTFGSLETD